MQELYASQRSDILQIIRDCVEKSAYRLTAHASYRMVERDIILPELLHVLKTGRRNEKKDHFDPDYDTWNYAIEGKTKDLCPLRVITSFDSSNLRDIVKSCV